MRPSRLLLRIFQPQLQQPTTIMKTFRSFSSLSTFAVGTTTVMSSTAFVPAYSLLQRHYSFLALSGTPPDLPLPEPMTSLATPFVKPEPMLTDPTLLLARSPYAEEFVAEQEGNFVPASKSLRSRLNLPAAQLAATTNMRPRPRIVGHRGSLYEELENTRPGFLACARIADAVELDVFVLKDGSIVVFHGSGNDQNPGLLEGYCTNGEQVHPGATSILDLTYDETQQLVFNACSEELAAPDAKVLSGKIPTLEQVLTDLQPTGMEVKIELKGPGTAKPCVELVDRLGMAQQVSFSSFNLKEIETVRTMRPQTHPDGSYVYKTGALFNEVPTNFIQLAQSVQASEVHLRYDTCTVDRIQAIHQAGMSSMAWFRGPVGMKSDVKDKYWDIGNEDPSCFEIVMETGVEQLCVNKPKVLYEYLKTREENDWPSTTSAFSAA